MGIIQFFIHFAYSIEYEFSNVWRTTAWHCAKIKHLSRQLYVFTSLNARRGNIRWLVSCSFQWRARTMEVVVGSRTKAMPRESRESVSSGCRWILEWKSGSAGGEEKKRKERERERVKQSSTAWLSHYRDCSAMSTDNGRQHNDDFFFVAKTRKKKSSPFHLHPSISSRHATSAPFRPFARPVTSFRSWLNVTENEVTECQYYVITVPAFSFPTLKRSFVVVLTPNTKIHEPIKP